jgi:hypothetical protein
MGRIGVRRVVAATVALCLAACCIGVASARADGAKTIATTRDITFGTSLHGQMFGDAFFSGFSVAYWSAPLTKGQHITIRTTAAHGGVPPCQTLYMPGTDDSNVGATTPLLNPDSQKRNGSHDVQTFVATETGGYVLAMTNLDSFLSGPLQCLDAAPGQSFTFTVTATHPGARSHSSGGRKVAAQGVRGPSHVVQPGQSLWTIAEDLLRAPSSVGQVAFEVGRLWQLNAGRIGTGDPDLIYAGQYLRLN